MNDFVYKREKSSNRFRFYFGKKSYEACNIYEFEKNTFSQKFDYFHIKPHTLLK